MSGNLCVRNSDGGSGPAADPEAAARKECAKGLGVRKMTLPEAARRAQLRYGRRPGAL